MDRLAALLIGRSLRMLRRGALFFGAVFLVMAAVFIIADPRSPSTWLIVAITGLLGWSFWRRTQRWHREWGGLLNNPVERKAAGDENDARDA